MLICEKFDAFAKKKNISENFYPEPVEGLFSKNVVIQCKIVAKKESAQFLQRFSEKLLKFESNKS